MDGCLQYGELVYSCQLKSSVTTKSKEKSCKYYIN